MKQANNNKYKNNKNKMVEKIVKRWCRKRERERECNDLKRIWSSWWEFSLFAGFLQRQISPTKRILFLSLSLYLLHHPSPSFGVWTIFSWIFYHFFIWLNNSIFILFSKITNLFILIRLKIFRLIQN